MLGGIDATVLRDAGRVADASSSDAVPRDGDILSNGGDSGIRVDSGIPADAGLPVDSGFSIDAGIPQEGTVCDPAMFDSKCADPRFLGRCVWNGQLGEYAIAYHDCWFAEHPGWNTFETCQSDVQEGGELVDKCQCEAEMNICYPNPCAGDCDPAAIIDRCVVFPNSPGDTTTRLIYVESCSAPESCAPDWRGRVSSGPITCADYGAQSTLDAAVGFPDAAVGFPDACIPQTDLEFCANIAANCDGVEGLDNCGQPRTADCGTCIPPATCDCGNSPCIGSFTISNAQDVATLSACTSISGDLLIDRFADIANLSGLDSLVSVGGSLLVGPYYVPNGNYSLTEVSGLTSLSWIGGDLNFSSNALLTTIGGLNSLDAIGGDCVIQGNVALTSLMGLSSVLVIQGDTSISGNALVNLSGLDNLSLVDGSLNIYNNDRLTSFVGLGNLDSIGGTLWIYNNDLVVDLSGLNSLRSVGNILNVAGNAQLASLSGAGPTGLESLTSVGGILLIYDNPSLMSLSGLQNLAGVGGHLRILSNSVLVSLNALYGVLSVGGNLQVDENAALPVCAAIALRDSVGTTNISGSFPTDCECIGTWEAMSENCP